MKLKTFPAALLILGLLASVPAFAAESALPTKPQSQSEAARSVQSKVDAKATDQAAEKRNNITADAVSAINESKVALKLLDQIEEKYRR